MSHKFFTLTCKGASGRDRFTGDYSDFTYTCSHGATPGNITVTLPYKLTIKKTVTFAWQWNDQQLGGGMSLPECQLVDVRISRTPEGGTIYHHTFYDRRWNWASGYITGNYNIRDERGEIVYWSKTYLDVIVKRCLDAMGVERYELRNLPTNDAFPQCQWDYENPAQVLQSLLDSLGFRLIYQPGLGGSKDKVVIQAAGTGLSLPDDSLNVEYAESRTPKPDKVTVIGAPIEVQGYWQLGPVGLDLDGSIKRPIEKCIFTPPGGWGHSPPPQYPGVSKSEMVAKKLGTETDATRLAQGSIYKWYQVTGCDPSSGEQKPPEIGGFTDAVEGTTLANPLGTLVSKRLIVLTDHMNDTVTNYNGSKQQKPAEVWGTFKKDSNLRPNAKIADRVKFGFSIDGHNGLVQLSQPLCRIVQEKVPAGKAPDPTKATIAPAELSILCAANIIDPETNTVMRYIYERELVKGGKAEHVIHRPEIHLSITGEYDQIADPDDPQIARWKLKKTNHTEDAADKEASYWVDAYLKQFELPSGETRVYAGVKTIVPDGAIQQVSWTFTVQNGSRTTASLHREHASYTAPYPERRRIELTNAQQQALTQAREMERKVKAATQPAGGNAPQVGGPG